MTIKELQDLLDGAGASIAYLGRGGGRSKKAVFVCSITPSMGSSRWRLDEWCMRGKGSSMEEALEDSLEQLSVFLVARLNERDQ